MTLDILNSWDPHAATLMETLRHRFRVVARKVEDESPDSAADRAINVELLKRDFNRHFYTQFKTLDAFEKHIAVISQLDGEDIDTLAGREAAEIHKLRGLMPYGEVMTSSGSLFAGTRSVQGAVRDFSKLLNTQISPRISNNREDKVVTIFERTNNAFNVCLVATRHNTVRDHADMLGRVIQKNHDYVWPFHKQLNVFRFLPAEESAISNAPDKLVQIVEKGKTLDQPIFHEAIPKRLDQIWASLGAYLDYRSVGDFKLKLTVPAHTVAHRAYRDFSLGL